MTGKHIVLIVCIIVVGVVIASVVKDITAPKLTDPIAQRISAIGHAGLNFEDAAKRIQELIVVDSLSHKK